MEAHCKSVNTNKTKIMVFRNGGCLPNNLNFVYNNSIIEIVSKFCYLGVVFTSGGSNSETQKTLSGQALKDVAANICHFGTSGFSFLKYLVNGCRYFPNILYLETY